MVVQDRTVFPAYLPDVQELVEAHKELEDEKLLLALYYAPDSSNRSPHDVFLFEIYDGFHRNTISPYRDFEDVTYGSTEAFPLGRDQRLHIVLTNPETFTAGFKENWPLAAEIRDSVRRGAYEVVYAASTYKGFVEQLRVVHRVG